MSGQIVSRDLSVATKGGARIRFVEAGSGPALLLVHDCAASHETFARVIGTLARSFHVVAPDLPGFGGSEKPDPMRYAYGYDAFSESLFDLVAGLGLGRVHVCGHGMGGGVGLTLAARHPSMVHRLVFVDADVFPASEHPLDRAGRIPLVGSLLFRQMMGPALFRRYIEGTVYAGAAHVAAERVASFYESFHPPGARQALLATILAKADTRPLVARLPRLSSDALVVWGRDDRLAPVEHGRRLARELRARFEVLECGRCPPDEMPEAFATTVASFLGSSNVRPSRSPEAAPASIR